MSAASRRPILCASAVAAAMALSLAPALAVAARPAQPFAVSAVFPPWWPRARVEAAVADIGIVTRHGRLGSVVTLTGDATLEARLKRAGAWALLDPRLTDCIA